MIAIAAFPLLVAVPACASHDGAAAGVTVTDVAIDADEHESVAGVTAWREGAVAITRDGSVLRSSDGRRWDALETAGLVGGEVARESTRFSGIAAGDGFVLAAGTRAVETDEDQASFTPVLWRSDDGEQWERIEPRGLTARFLDAVVASEDGFVVFGNEDVPPPPAYVPTDEEAEDGELPATIPVTSTWRSSDGEAWERFGENVLPPGENSLEGVAAAAIVGDEVLASLGAECNGCYDDFAFILSKSDDGGKSWNELDPAGLDDLDLANSDVIPVIASTDSGFVAVGTSGAEDTEATLWRSDDGHDWAGKRRLGGPKIEAYADGIDAVAATDSGVIALKIWGDRLIVWQVEL